MEISELIEAVHGLGVAAAWYEAKSGQAEAELRTADTGFKAEQIEVAESDPPDLSATILVPDSTRCSTQ